MQVATRTNSLVNGASRAGFAGFAVVGAAGLALIYATDPTSNQVFPVCPMLRAFGVFCPGCGGTRAVYSLMHGDFAAAFGFNAAFVLLLPFIALLLFKWARQAWSPSRFPFRVDAEPWMAWSLLAFIAAFTIARNLPLAPVNALAP